MGKFIGGYINGRDVSDIGKGTALLVPCGGIGEELYLLNTETGDWEYQDTY